jgi:predicted RNA-binding Zn-ribbon protein involved in translation (DUF1610 family)
MTTQDTVQCEIPKALWCMQCHREVLERDAVGEVGCPRCGALLVSTYCTNLPKHYVFYIASKSSWYWRLWLVVSNPFRFVIRGYFYWQ